MVDIENLLSQINIVDYISQFADLELKSGEYWCSSPLNEADTNPSFSINEDKQSWYCFSTGQGGNLIDFIMAKEEIPFRSALEKLCALVGADNVTSLSSLKKLEKVCKKFLTLDDNRGTIKQTVLPDEVMSQFADEPIVEWITEGIQDSVLRKYQVRYDHQEERIVFPIWNSKGEIISICGRTLKNHPRKYTYYTKIGTSNFLWGLWQNLPEIEVWNEVIVFEGAKSVMKAEGWGYGNCVAAMTSHLSSGQIEELVKIDVRDVIICFDKGVEFADIKKKTRLLRKFKNCYAVLDTEGLLEVKEAPVDRGKNVFRELYQKRLRIK